MKLILLTLHSHKKVKQTSQSQVHTPSVLLNVERLHISLTWPGVREFESESVLKDH